MLALEVDKTLQATPPKLMGEVGMGGNKANKKNERSTKKKSKKPAYQVRVPTAAKQRRRCKSSPQCRRSYPTTAAAQLAVGSPSATKTSNTSTSTGISNSFCSRFFQLWDQLRISSRRVMLLLLLRSVYVATAQARSAPSAPGARHLGRGGLTPRCCCCCYHGVLELK